MVLTAWERKGRLGHGNVTRIARQLGVTLSAVSHVLHGRRRSARVERAIAKAIRCPVDLAFPPPPDATRRGAA